MMQASLITKEDALLITRRDLGLPAPCSSPLDRALIAQALRRAIFQNAPCGHQIAKRLVFDALVALADEPETLLRAIEESLEHLIATGDVLELQTRGENRSRDILRPAPPSFVKRSTDTIILLGVAGEQITPEFEFSVTYTDTGLRVIQGDDADAICAALTEEGLIELQHKYWLHSPSPTTASSFVEMWKTKLPGERFAEAIDDLLVLNTHLDVTFYKGRWVSPSQIDSGVFIARRPQRFGADLWMLAEFEDGGVVRFVDIHSDNPKIRSCDEAWRIQAALDQLAGRPQILSVYVEGEDLILAFHSPIPSWIERRLLMFGSHISKPRSLLAFRLEADQAAVEIEWLRSILWINVIEREAA